MDHVIFITSQFPETHETFILREFRGLMRAEIPFEIVSLKRCRDKVVHPEVEPLRERTVTLGKGLATIGAGLGWWLKHPWKAVKAAATLARWTIKGKPGPLVNLGIFLMVGRMASLYAARADGIRLHAHWATVPASVAVLLSRTLGVPWGMTAHAWDIYKGDRLLEEKIGEADFVVTCTGYNRRHLNRLPGGAVPGKVFLNYHGLELDSLPRKTDYGLSTPMRALGAGRLVEQKGFEILVEAMARTQTPIAVTLVGSGPLEESLRRRAQRLGVGDRLEIISTSPHADVLERMRTSDLFAAPSVIASDGDRDGIPNVVLEAMGVGLPVVASTVSGIPEVVVDGRSGLSVEPGSAQSLAEAIDRMASDEYLRRELADEARNRVHAMFDIERNVEELVQIFQGRHTDADRTRRMAA